MSVSLAVAGWLLASTGSAGCSHSPSAAVSNTADASIDADADADTGSDRRREDQALYMAFTDRFVDGDRSNNGAGRGDCYDPSDPFFFHGGDLAGVYQHVDYLESLGVTTVWISPLYRQIPEHFLNPDSSQRACGYHGYTPDFAVPDDGAMEPKFGDQAALDRLVGELARHDMGLMIDMIVNHAGFGAQATVTNPEFFHPYPECRTADLIGLCLYGLPDFAQENPTVANYLTQLSRGWVERNAIAGIRMDSARHVPLTYFENDLIPALRAVRPSMFLVAEDYDSDIGAYAPFLEAGFDSLFNFALQGAFVDLASGRSVDGVAARVQETIARLGIDNARRLVTFLDNQDMARLMDQAASAAPLTQAERYHLALTALFTLPGIPQLYYGDEIGMHGGGDPDNRRDMPAWAFSAAGRATDHDGFLPGPQVTFDLVVRLGALRKAHEALRRGSYAELWRQNGSGNPNVLAFFRAAGSDRVITVINDGDDTVDSLGLGIATHPEIDPADIAALADGTVLRDQLGLCAPETATMTGGQLRISMPPRCAAVYTPE